MAAQTPSTIGTANTAGNAHSRSNQGSRQPATQTTEPIDRSMPPVTMTNAAATLSRPNNPTRCSTFSRL